MKTEIVNVRKVNKQRPHFDIYIGRAVRYTEFTKNSIWYNPFKLPNGSNDVERQEVLDLYEEYIKKKIAVDPVKYDLESLRGKVLGCWCKPLKCHGDVLLKLLEDQN